MTPCHRLCFNKFRVKPEAFKWHYSSSLDHNSGCKTCLTWRDSLRWLKWRGLVTQDLGDLTLSSPSLLHLIIWCYRWLLLAGKALTSCFSSHRINAVSNGQVRGDSYSEGCLGQTGNWAPASYCKSFFLEWDNYTNGVCRAAWVLVRDGAGLDSKA